MFYPRLAPPVGQCKFNGRYESQDPRGGPIRVCGLVVEVVGVRRQTCVLKGASALGR